MLILAVFGSWLSTLNYPTWFVFMVVSVPITLLLFFLFALPALNQLFNNTFLGQGRKAAQILKIGRPATATVIFIRENSQGGVVSINNHPILNLKLLIEGEKVAPYEVSLEALIPRSMVPQFQPGANFKVKIDPENPQNVVKEQHE
jgi:hypothetical protein